MGKTTRLAKVLSIIVTITVGLATTARAQIEDSARIIFSEHYGYLAAPAELIADSVTRFYPDPLGRYALLSCSEPVLARRGLPISRVDQTRRAFLLLYDSHADRTRLLWSDTAEKPLEVYSVSWLGGSDAAIVTVGERKFTPTHARVLEPLTQLYLVRANASGTPIRMILGESLDLRVAPSPKLPVAVVAEPVLGRTPEGRLTVSFRYFTVDARGIIGLPIDIDGGFLHEDIWREAGAVTYFSSRAAGEIAPSVTYEYYSYNVLTNTLHRVDQIPEQDAEAARKKNAEVRLDTGSLTSMPPLGGDGKIPIVQGVKITPLWFARADGKRKDGLPDSLLVAPDFDESYLFADESAIFYISKRSIYSIRLTRQKRPDADVAFRTLQERLSAERLKKAAPNHGLPQDRDWEGLH